MLLKKMTVSLMSLITIFALAFTTTSAFAAVAVEFTAEDVSSAGEIQIEYGTGKQITVKVDKLIDPATLLQIKVVPINKFGGVIGDTTPVAVAIVSQTATVVRKEGGQEFHLTLPDAATTAVSGNDAINPVKVLVIAPKGTIKSVDGMDSNDATTKAFYLVSAEPGAVGSDAATPKVVSITRITPVGATAGGAFVSQKVTGPFDVKIVLTEQPKAFTASHIKVDEGTASAPVAGIPFAAVAGAAGTGRSLPDPNEGSYTTQDPVPGPTGRDNKYHPYLVTITPYLGMSMVKISIKEFHDNALPSVNVYTPIDVAHKPNGREQLKVAVSTNFVAPGAASMFSAPHEESAQFPAANGIPGDDIFTEDEGDSGAEKVKEAAEVDTSVRIPMAGKIYISEIMFAGGGMLPQWIEIANSSRTEQVNLGGWTLTVENTGVDADVSVGSKATFTIPDGMKINPSGQKDTPSTILVVTEQGRTDVGASQIFNLWTEQQVVLIRLDVFKRRYSLLSEIAFKIILAPPDVAAPLSATDVVGNLTDDGTVAWALPMREEGARSSMIRRHVPGTMGSGEPKDGTLMDAWVLASDTGFTQSMHLSARSYYGLPIDVGTPGFRAGGALPVELSHFRPERKKDTGAVVITWSTQSELNNAGFFIKRSQQKDGEFTVINATMVAGAGTTSEKQFYTYTDTTAQPNVVYYYQIEDVSLDGNRQTLTRGIRLKGHVGAAGKATVTWGELKTSHE